MEVKIIGPDNGKSSYLYSIVQTAILELHLEASLIKSENLDQEHPSNNYSFPILVVNNEVCVSGRVPTVKETKKILLQTTQEPEGKNIAPKPK
jgi:hypothetical protein